MTTIETERRVLNGQSELRVNRADDGSATIFGYAAVFDSLSDDLGGFRETIKRGAFRKSIAGGADVRALVGHDSSKILGRSSAGTLRVKEDRHGLSYEIDVPDTSAGRDIATSIERGDVSGSSFQFRTIEDRWRTVDGEEQRELVEVELIDVSPVTYPAYPATDVALRSLKTYQEKQEADANNEEYRGGIDMRRRKLGLEEIR